MTANELKLNGNKTESLLISNAFAVKGIRFLFLAGFHVPSFTAVQEGGQCIAVVEPHLCFE